jgi:chorismate-pyruvate lyase
MRRTPFLTACATPETLEALPLAQRRLALLLAQDGSPTRLCERLLGAPVFLRLLSQRDTQQVPEAVRALLPAATYIERISSKEGSGQVMMDAISYIAADGLSPTLRAGLLAGRLPMGHLLEGDWVRRVPVAPPAAMFDTLWATVGCPDPAASRAYRLDTPEGPRMLIAETFRAGMEQAVA